MSSSMTTRTRPKGISAQLDEPCACGAKLEHVKCSVTARLHRFNTEVLYEHRGTHTHARPACRLHLTLAERDELPSLITQHPNSGPLSLIVGVPTTNPVCEIFPQSPKERRGRRSQHNLLVGSYRKFLEHFWFVYSSFRIA